MQTSPSVVNSGARNPYTVLKNPRPLDGWKLCINSPYITLSFENWRHTYTNLVYRQIDYTSPQISLLHSRVYVAIMTWFLLLTSMQDALGWFVGWINRYGSVTFSHNTHLNRRNYKWSIEWDEPQIVSSFIWTCLKARIETYSSPRRWKYVSMYGSFIDINIYLRWERWVIKTGWAGEYEQPKTTRNTIFAFLDDGPLYYEWFFLPINTKKIPFSSPWCS